MVSINPQLGGVLHGEKAVCKLVFCPPSRTTLKDCELVLKVRIFFFLFTSVKC